MPPQTTNVTAPYNFVPLSNRVLAAGEISPDLAGPPSQDTPQVVTAPTSGRCLSGKISFEIEVDAGIPILVGGTQPADQPRQFMSVVNDTGVNTPVIPGSTLRGMIRNVVEIASFSRMALVDDKRVGVRDLNARLDYSERLSETVAPSVFRPRSHAGWLRVRGSNYCLETCEFARIEHDEVVRIGSSPARDFGIALKSLKKKKNPNDRDARTFTEDFKMGATRENLEFRLGPPERHLHSCGHLIYREATYAPGEQGTVNGELVFTGIPGENKHMEFVFHGESGVQRPVPPKVWRKFIAVHEEQEKENRTWSWRRGQLKAGQRIPVFFLTDDDQPDGRITDIGLAMMFKIGADNTVRDLIGNTSPRHLDATLIDLATRIFGRAPDPRAIIDGFRTRLSFGWAPLMTRCETLECQTSSLSRPKVSYAPAYIRQRDFGDDQGNLPAPTTHLSRIVQTKNGSERWKPTSEYRSWMNWRLNGVRQKEEIRGWKRYPARRAPETPPAPITDGTTSILHPIVAQDDSPLRFVGTIRYHNLHPVELGAVIWALTLGGNPQLRHALGTGKKWGWGLCRAAVMPDTTQQAALEDFSSAMTDAVPGWARTPQIRTLLAMANPAIGYAKAELLREMRLQVPGTNEFLEAKKSGEILPDYVGAGIGTNTDSAHAKTEQNVDPIVRSVSATTAGPPATKQNEAARELTPEEGLTSHPEVGDQVAFDHYVRGIGSAVQTFIGTVTNTDQRFVHVTYDHEGEVRKRKIPRGDINLKPDDA